MVRHNDVEAQEDKPGPDQPRNGAGVGHNCGSFNLTVWRGGWGRFAWRHSESITEGLITGGENPDSRGAAEMIVAWLRHLESVLCINQSAARARDSRRVCSQALGGKGEQHGID